MSFGGSVPKEQFKSFVTETEIEEKRKVRQQEWEKVRKPDEPLEAPEVPVDNRTLYDRLQAKKALEQEEKDEAKKMKNFVRGLEHDEVEFLDQLDDIYTKMERDKIAEEKAALREFKEKAAILQSSSIPSGSSVASSSVAGKRKDPPSTSVTADLPKKKSQKELLASAVRLKRPSSTDEETTSPEVLAKDGSGPTQAEPDSKQPGPRITPTAMSGYGSSSDSE
ncbi:hypothetical protein RvY_15404 [Ramazzottius varieornatus]|uniref:FAM192A/Fyv6 N-terminal domain-containing protein n=1 Tax=Ramazzottius varieornatus TaxID=947166 RepID=A0A1D1VW27_RAMVA|nr:hypothetical protein RvY_15404 [Ramazzottius varieornatus]